MQYRRFGRTGWSISEVGFGCWGLGGGWGPMDDGQGTQAIARYLPTLPKDALVTVSQVRALTRRTVTCRFTLRSAARRPLLGAMVFRTDPSGKITTLELVVEGPQA